MKELVPMHASQDLALFGRRQGQWWLIGTTAAILGHFPFQFCLSRLARRFGTDRSWERLVRRAHAAIGRGSTTTEVGFTHVFTNGIEARGAAGRHGLGNHIFQVAPTGAPACRSAEVQFFL